VYLALVHSTCKQLEVWFIVVSAEFKVSIEKHVSETSRVVVGGVLCVNILHSLPFRPVRPKAWDGWCEQNSVNLVYIRRGPCSRTWRVRSSRKRCEVKARGAIAPYDVGNYRLGAYESSAWCSSNGVVGSSRCPQRPKLSCCSTSPAEAWPFSRRREHPSGLESTTTKISSRWGPTQHLLTSSSIASTPAEAITRLYDVCRLKYERHVLTNLCFTSTRARFGTTVVSGSCCNSYVAMLFTGRDCPSLILAGSERRLIDHQTNHSVLKNWLFSAKLSKPFRLNWLYGSDEHPILLATVVAYSPCHAAIYLPQEGTAIMEMRDGIQEDIDRKNMAKLD